MASLLHEAPSYPASAQRMNTILADLEAAKLRLSDAQTEYLHCFARGDFAACSKAKRAVNKQVKEVQNLVAQKLALR